MDARNLVIAIAAFAGAASMAFSAAFGGPPDHIVPPQMSTPTPAPAIEGTSMSEVIRSLSAHVDGAHCMMMAGGSLAEAPQRHGLTHAPAEVASLLARQGLTLADFEQQRVLPDRILLISADGLRTSSGARHAAGVREVALLSNGWQTIGSAVLYDCAGATPPPRPTGEPIEVTPMPTD